MATGGTERGSTDDLSAILADGYDREAYERVRRPSEALDRLGERLGRLVPHPEVLLRDLFCALFKLNAQLRPAAELAPSALLGRSVVEAVLAAGGLDALRSRTGLDASSAAIATVMIAERILQALKEAFRGKASELAHAHGSARDEEELAGLRGERAQLERMPGVDDATRDALAGEIDADVKSMSSRLGHNRRKQRDAQLTAAGIEPRLHLEIDGLTGRLEDAEQRTRDLGIGGGGTVDAQRRVELGERVMKSRKLKLLARLVGAFREVAFEARRRRAARSPQELHAISVGADLDQLLPSELIGLGAASRGASGRALRLDFVRRLSERQLLQYRLDAPSTRGPMVICLDGSGSMQGRKELWGKAVALTLMEIARRERRGCLAIIFSAGDPPFEVELLARAGRGARSRVRDEEVLRFAEHFPGGGTEFEPPLERALAAVTEGRCRRGDIVFITDGQAPVSDALLARVQRERARHRFKIRGILVDVDDHQGESLRRFADDVRTVTELATDSLGDLFAAV